MHSTPISTYIHDPHFLTIILNFYKFHNTNGNRHTFQSNLNFYRNLRNPLRLNHGIFHPLSFSLYFSHISKFHSIPLKISKTQIGGEWIRLQFARRFDYLPSIPIFVSQQLRFSAIFLNFTGFGTRLECAAVSLPAFSTFFFPLFLSPSSPLLSSWNLMLRLDASVAAIAERAISSYDYVHAAISTYPAFLCMNFDIRAVGFPFNSVYTDFPPNYLAWWKKKERKRNGGGKLIVTSRIVCLFFKTRKHLSTNGTRNFCNVNFISPSFLHWLKRSRCVTIGLGIFT